MIVPKKSIGLIALLFLHCFAVGQNCVNSTAFRQDSIDIGTDSLRQRNAMYNCDTVRKDSFRKQHRLSFVRKEQGLTRGISPNAVKMQKFDPYKNPNLSEFNRYGITNPKIVAETLARG